MEHGGTRLLGYNQNAGALIAMRLRTMDLATFMPYDRLVDTLLHELCHNEVGPHNEQFWHLFCQLKASAATRAAAAMRSRGASHRAPVAHRRITFARTPTSRLAALSMPAAPPRPTQTWPTSCATCARRSSRRSSATVSSPRLTLRSRSSMGT